MNDNLGISSLAYYEKAVALIETYTDYLDAAGPVSEVTIAKAECDLSLCFPATYRAFLRQYGTIIFAGEEVYGLVENTQNSNSVPDVVFATLTERRATKLNPNIIYLYAVGNGEYYGLLVSGEDNDCPILALWFTGDEVTVTEQKAPNFGQWFYKLIVESFEDKDLLSCSQRLKPPSVP